MIDVITGVLTQVPPEHHAKVEVDLLTFAAEAGHKQVAALGARILAHLNPDGAEPDDTVPAIPTRELFLRRKRTGIWELNGRFGDETGTRASALLDALAERRTSDEGPDHRPLPNATAMPSPTRSTSPSTPQTCPCRPENEPTSWSR